MVLSVLFPNLLIELKFERVGCGILVWAGFCIFIVCFLEHVFQHDVKTALFLLPHVLLYLLLDGTQEDVEEVRGRPHYTEEI